MNGYLKKFNKFLTDPEYRFAVKTRLGFYKKLDDAEFLKKRFQISMGYRLDLSAPVTFNEKLQWLKLHDRNPLYTALVDKYEVKKYVAGKIGEEYIIKNYGVWNSFDEINFDELPDQFVLKCTHDSGGLVICEDKSKLDIAAARVKINKCLTRNYFDYGREWPYKNVKPRIIAEEYLIDHDVNELRDYKFMCFGGVPKVMFVASDRQRKDEETKFDFFDMDYHPLGIRNGHPNSVVLPAQPKNFEEMKRLAAELSAGIPHVRVDLYEIDGKVYFGELTFSHYSGFVPFVPDEWDHKLGEMLKLPES